MKNSKRYQLIDLFIFMYLNAIISFLLYQLHLNNFTYPKLNNIDFNIVIIIYGILLAINGFIYFKFAKQVVFRFCIMCEFFIVYMFSIATLNLIIIPYFIIIILILASLYKNPKIYSIYFASYLGVIIGYLSFISYYKININDNSIIINPLSYMHIMISCIIALFITLSFINTLKNASRQKTIHIITNNELEKTIIKMSQDESKDNLDNNITKISKASSDDEYLNITSIEAVESIYKPQLFYLHQLIK